MLLLNASPLCRTPLDPRDAETLGPAGADAIEAYLAFRDKEAQTPLVSLKGLAQASGVARIDVKDESKRLGLGSFKALGGAYALSRLLLDEAGRRLGRTLGFADLATPEVRAIAATMTFACATDGNHGRSVAQGAGLVGARSVIFVHATVSDARVAAIARYGAEIVRVNGSYDDSVREAARVAEEKGWTIVSDTSWPGYETIPGLVMQGYTAIVREALRVMAEPPTHVFVQAGVGGIAAAVAGHFSALMGERAPLFTVVEPARAACVYESARAGRKVVVEPGEATVMAMLDCYEVSDVAWRVLQRAADAFMIVDEEDAVSTMRRLADPEDGDAAIVSGESGGVGLAGFLKLAADPEARARLKITAQSRIFVVNTEGATDPEKYREIVGRTAEAVAAK